MRNVRHRAAAGTGAAARLTMNAHPSIATSEVYESLVQSIGEEGAMALVRAFGGRRIYVPQEIAADSELGVVLSAEAAARLSAYHYGTHLHIPRRGREKARVLQLAKAGGLTRHQIAGETGYSERQVYRIIGAGGDDRQASLFGDD